MKSYKSLTFRYLRNQMKRTVLTVLGVILSISLITAIGTMMESLKYETVQHQIRNSGNFHASISGVDKEYTNVLARHTRLAKLGIATIGGYAKAGDNSYIKVAGLDKNYQEMMFLSLLEGKMPEKPDEIAVEKWILNELPGEAKLGERITLIVEDKTEAEIVDKVFGKEADKKAVRPILPEKTITLTICGILSNSDNSQLMSTSLGAVLPEVVESIRGAENTDYGCYFLIKDGLKIQQSISELSEDLGISRSSINDNKRLLALLGESEDEQINDAVMYVIAFLVVLIVIATAAVIYNAFHISVIERIRQFGILRSVGSTPKQIRAIVLGEVAVILLIALPLGLISGIMAVKIVLGLLNLSKYSVFFATKVIVSFRVLAISSIVGITAVFISALSPVFLAGRVSPIQAIMNQSGDKKAIKKYRSHKLVRLIFGVEGEMAYKNLRRNRKRLFVTVFSMCIGIVIFIVFNTFAYYAFEGLHGNDNYVPDFKLHSLRTEQAIYDAEVYNEITGIAGVEKAYKIMEQDRYITFSMEGFTEEYKAELAGNKINLNVLGDSGCFNPPDTSILWGYDNMALAEVKKVLIEGSADVEVLDKEKGVLVVVNQEIRRASDKKQAVVKALDIKVGEYIYIDTKGMLGQGSENIEDLTRVKVVGLLDKVPLYVPYPIWKIAIITSENTFKHLVGNEGYHGFDIEVTKDADKDAIKQRLVEISQSVKGGKLTDFGEMAGIMSQARLAVSVLLYGFVAVIALIGVLNIMNTISTNLILRTREFGTQRAIGMTMGQMKKMIVVEGIFYGIIGAVWGTSIGLILSRLLFNSMNNVYGMVWKLPINAVIIAVTGTIAVTLLSTLVPLKRVANMNIIEAIGREE
ncbi:MAG: ABC transporter permease [Bacillota bacterium]